MARKISFEVLIRTAFLGAIPKRGKHPTKTELARRLGVSRSTVRRWLNDESKPAPITLDRMEKTLRKEYKRVRSISDRSNRAERATPPPMAIPFAGRRMMIKERDIYGEETGRKILSEWVNYPVFDYDRRAVFDLLRGLRDSGAVVQFIYRVPRGGTSLGGREYKGGGRSSTGPLKLSEDMGDAELYENTLLAFDDAPGLRLLYVAVVDIVPAPKKPRKRS